MRIGTAILSACLAALFALTGCADEGPYTLRERLAAPVEFQLMPYVSMAEVGYTLDGESVARELAIADGRAVTRAGADGELELVAFELAFEPIAIDGARSLSKLSVGAQPETTCVDTEWAPDDDSCFARGAASLKLAVVDGEEARSEQVPLDVMVAASLYEGAPVIDLMTGESPSLALWPDLTLTAITLVIHGVAR